MPNKSVNLTEKQTHACAFKIAKFTSAESNIREQSFFFIITIPLSSSAIECHEILALMLLYFLNLPTFLPSILV